MDQELFVSTDAMHKWHRMSVIVSQHADSLHRTVAQSSNKLLIIRSLSENFLIFLLQYSGLMFSTLTDYPSPIWFASGTSTAYLFLRGTSVLPGIWLGTLLAYFLANFSVGVACIVASVFSLQALLLLKLCYYYTGPSLLFHQRKAFLHFVLLCSVLTALISFPLVYLLFVSRQLLVSPLQIWLQWWIANLNGIVIFSCALITWDAYFPQISSLKKINLPPFIILLFISCCLLVTILLSHQSNILIPCFLINLILMSMISIYYGWCGAIAALFLSALFISVLLSMHIITHNLLSITLFLPISLCIQAILGLFLGISYLQKSKF